MGMLLHESWGMQIREKEKEDLTGGISEREVKGEERSRYIGT